MLTEGPGTDSCVALGHLSYFRALSGSMLAFQNVLCVVLASASQMCSYRERKGKADRQRGTITVFGCHLPGDLGFVAHSGNLFPRVTAGW